MNIKNLPVNSDMEFKNCMSESIKLEGDEQQLATCSERLL